MSEQKPVLFRTIGSWENVEARLLALWDEGYRVVSHEAHKERDGIAVFTFVCERRPR